MQKSRNRSPGDKDDVVTILDILRSPFGYLILGVLLALSALLIGNTYYAIGVMLYWLVMMLRLRYLAYKLNPGLMAEFDGSARKRAKAAKKKR